MPRNLALDWTGRKPRRLDRQAEQRVAVLEAAIDLERRVIDARVERLARLQAEHESACRELDRIKLTA